MKIKYFLLLSFIFLYCYSLLHAQQVQKSWILETPESGNKDYVARESIRLKPGFRYMASTGNTFTARIDPTLLFPPSESTYMDESGNTNSTRGAVVGGVPGAFDVNPTGAAMYSIPIEVPAGIQGMQPNISLVYNSRSGNGIAGWGWSLSGLSAITVGNKNIFSDAAVSPIGLMEVTDLYLDGNKLAVKPGFTYGANNAEYETENKSYVQIRQGISPKFTVTGKDGTVMEYGQAVKPKGSFFDVALWLLTKVRDSSGNYMIYNYKTNTAGTQTVLDCISYGSNGTSASPLKVQFYYQPNPHPKKQHISGYYFEDAQLLDYITVTSDTGNYLLRKYDLSYTTRDEINFMTSIRETGEDGETFPAANFEYGADSKMLARTAKPLRARTNVKSRYYATADITGNGYTDLIEFTTHETTDNQKVKHRVTAYDGKTFQVVSGMQNIDIGETQFFFEGSALMQGSKVFADFNGDGKKMILVPRCVKDNLFGGNYMQFSDVKPVFPNQYPLYIEQHLTTSEELTTYTIADLNNDGCDEIISIERITNNSNAYPGKIIYVKKNDYSYDIAPTDEITGDDISVPWIGKGDKPMEIYVSDFNSDGLKDMMVVCKNGYHIFKNNGGTKGADGIVRISFSRFGPFTGSINADSDGDINRAGDFNGDGLLDIITRRGAEWCLYLGTGTLSLSSHFNKIVLTNIEARDEEEAKDDEKDDCIVTDFDHDGKSDIIIYNATYRESTVTWYKSNGTSFTKNRTVTPNDIEYYYKGHSAVGDFDGDGREDLFIYSSDFFNSGKDPGKGFVYGCFNKDYDANLLKKISSGINRYGGSNTNTVEIKYQPLTCPETPDGKDFYQKGNTAKYPVADLLAPLYAVSKTIAAAGERRETDYSYAGGKVHLTGRGFLGFEEITAKNDTRNVKIKTTTVYDYEKCLPERQIAVTSTTDDKMISTVENTFTNTKSGKIYTSVLNKTIETNHLNTLSKTTEYLNYDAQGNLTQSKITQGGLTIEENTVFAQKGAWAWGANKPVFITTVYKQTDGDTHTRKRSFDYDTQGRITNDTIDPDDDNELVTLYSNYDVFGNLQTITTKTKVMDESGSYSDVSRTVTATYTPSGRFLHTKENPPGETTTFEWDEKRGVLNSVTDYYNRKTAYGYDNFGRLKLTVYPDGNKTVNTLQWAGEISGKPYNAKYYRYCETSGQSPVWTWHDASDREIRTDSYGLNGKKISVNTQYNSNGKVFRIREPYFADVYTPEGWAVEYEYDEFGRTAKITTNAGTTGYTYSGLTTTVSSPAETRKTTINQAGWVVEEETNGKKVNFTHYASGLVKSATPEGGTGSIEMNYDLQGNRISIKDPDAGIVESRYDGFGQLSRSSQKVHINAPEEVKTTHIYHADGRLDYTKTEGKETNLVTYEYDANMRVETILQNNHRQTFTYDDLDRVTNVKEEIDSRVFEHQTSYDAFGRVARETFPSGYYTINKYDKYGFLTSVKDNSARLIRQIIDENAKGQVTQEKRGGQTTKYTYDKRGFMTYALFSNIPDLTSIGYAYDGKGNLSSKTLTGASNQQTARYTYDSNNRLTDWVYSSPMYATTGENGQPVYTTQRHHVTYDATTGNITAKSDLNGYVMTYGENGKPHALTSIADRPDVFPSDNLAAAYTDFKKLKSLTEGNKRYSLTYGVDGQRRKSVYEIDHVAEQTKYYTGNYEEVTEKDGNIRKIHYLHGAVFIDNSTKEDEFYYVYVDNIGSLTALVNEDGTVAEHYAYDPWGNRLNPKDWRERDARSVRKLSRGFTMHEHIDRFGIINMNGRVYDPLTSQFLSPDPYIQAPADWVNYNRYAYCMNNPLSYIDPSGEIAWFVPVIIGAVIGGTSGAIIGHSKDAKGWDMVGYIAGGAVIGGLSGGAASGVSALGGAAWWAGATAGAVGGAGFNGLVTSWDAGAMLKGAGIGALSGFVGGGLGSAIGGGWGAFAGGAASSGLSTALYGGNLEQVGISMLLGGALSYGTYELTSYLSYKQADLEINGHRVSYKQFKTIQADYQRSRFWRKEYGGILTKNGGVVRAPAQNRHSLSVDFTGGMINAANNDGGVAATYHTHWARGGVDYYLSNTNDIVSRANAAYVGTTTNGPSPGDMSGLANHFGGNQFLIDRSHFYYYNTVTSANNNAFLFRYFPMYWLWLNK